MKKLIFRSFISEVSAFFLISVFSLTLIVWVMQSVNFLDLVSEDGHSLAVYFKYSLFTLPKIINRILVFSFFIATFFTIIKYHDNNEILIFWTNGITKFQFINNILKFSILLFIINLFLSFFIVPESLNKARSFLRDSNIDYFPTLIKPRKFVDSVKSLTIFIEKKNKNGELENIFFKEKIKDRSFKIVSAKKGFVYNKGDNSFLILYNGKITTINDDVSNIINFSKSEFNLSRFSSQTILSPKIQEINSVNLLKCHFMKFNNQTKFKDETNLDCINYEEKEIFKEVSKRVLNPFYMIIVSLISSLLILKSKEESNISQSKIILFTIGIFFLIFGEIMLSISNSINEYKNFFFIYPIIIIFIIYFYIKLKLKFT